MTGNNVILHKALSSVHCNITCFACKYCHSLKGLSAVEYGGKWWSSRTGSTRGKVPSSTSVCMCVRECVCVAVHACMCVCVYNSLCKRILLHGLTYTHTDTINVRTKHIVQPILNYHVPFSDLYKSKKSVLKCT